MKTAVCEAEIKAEMETGIRLEEMKSEVRPGLSYSKPSDKGSQCLKYGIGASKERRSLL
jgi:hypothetical protein